ncbi:SDR family NAD(P)-dependent oxidoreductase [Micavibrio aeruginosavorus]|uniref:3-hydroxyacyl-CoA dehydrogenase n=1 Tax=Micavibrio aeruginosavorus EPB TaxID=349215 RepID=M4VHT2_9BACT|nr:SDR family NAD(P)-dependent oxidoreductase [Micavibrio aeruginosavorus]AGH97601.1 3-hydroxyacyl-CoA dehydrogenase [Micavibrio aeruginosavorus EPB]
MDIQNQTVIITGGGSGMGAETARSFARAGANVVLWDMNLPAAEAVAKEIGGVAVQCDVTNENSVKAAIEESGSPRVLINCAGILLGKRIVGRDGPADLDHFMKVINVNLVGTYNTMRLVAGVMTGLDPVNDDGERGVIINAASIAAFEGQMGQVAYSASKGGIVGMTLPAARDLGKLGVRVMAIAPGAVQTPMIGTISQELQDSIAANIPFPSRMAKPDEFAKLALHIVDNAYLNGSVIRLDGASRLAAK